MIARYMLQYSNAVVRRLTPGQLYVEMDEALNTWAAQSRPAGCPISVTVKSVEHLQGQVEDSWVQISVDFTNARYKNQ